MLSLGVPPLDSRCDQQSSNRQEKKSLGVNTRAMSVRARRAPAGLLHAMPALLATCDTYHCPPDVPGSTPVLPPASEHAYITHIFLVAFACFFCPSLHTHHFLPPTRPFGTRTPPYASPHASSTQPSPLPRAHKPTTPTLLPCCPLTIPSLPPPLPSHSTRPRPQPSPSHGCSRPSTPYTPPAPPARHQRPRTLACDPFLALPTTPLQFATHCCPTHRAAPSHAGATALPAARLTVPPPQGENPLLNRVENRHHQTAHAGQTTGTSLNPSWHLMAPSRHLMAPHGTLMAPHWHLPGTSRWHSRWHSRWRSRWHPCLTCWHPGLRPSRHPCRHPYIGSPVHRPFGITLGMTFDLAIDLNMRPNMQPNMQPNIRPNIQPNIRPNIRPLQLDLTFDLTFDITFDISHNIRYTI